MARSRTDRLPRLQALRYSTLDHLLYVEWEDRDQHLMAAIPDRVVRERNLAQLARIMRANGLAISDHGHARRLLARLLRSIRDRLPAEESARLTAAC